MALGLSHCDSRAVVRPLEHKLEHKLEQRQPAEFLRETLARVEAWLIRRALDTNSGRRATTARLLGITREGLYKKMKRYGIT